jgi:hypothetical protein
VHLSNYSHGNNREGLRKFIESLCANEEFTVIAILKIFPREKIIQQASPLAGKQKILRRRKNLLLCVFLNVFCM